MDKLLKSVTHIASGRQTYVYLLIRRASPPCDRYKIKLAFHDADMDTDTDIIARIVAKMSACRSACYRNNFRKSSVSAVSARILARMSVSVSVTVSASWNSSFILLGDRGTCVNNLAKVIT